MTKRFPIGPLDISADNWAYVDEESFSVYHETRDAAGRHYKTELIPVPWAVLRLAIAYRDKQRLPRRNTKKSKG